VGVGGRVGVQSLYPCAAAGQVVPGRIRVGAESCCIYIHQSGQLCKMAVVRNSYSEMYDSYIDMYISDIQSCNHIFIIY